MRRSIIFLLFIFFSVLSSNCFARPVDDEIARDMEGVKKELRDRVHAYKRNLGRTTPKIVVPEDEDLYPLIHQSGAAQYILDFDDLNGDWENIQFKKIGNYSVNPFTIRTRRGFEFPKGMWLKRRFSRGIWDRYGVHQKIDIPINGYKKGTVRVRAKVNIQSKSVEVDEKLGFPMIISLHLMDKAGKLLEWNQRFYYFGSRKNALARRVDKNKWFKKTFIFSFDNFHDPEGNKFKPVKITGASLYGQGWDYEFWSYPITLTFE
ncbi:hypothetical protein ACFL35_07645 [Candidatus Riflebacteria bacterium]